MKSALLIFLICSINLFPQSERQTKGSDNGYAWLAMDDPALMYSTSKENYLSSILDRLKITNEKYPEIESLGCREDINKPSKDGKSNEISISDVVVEIDKFYSVEENLVIPIVFAYCYTIKKFAGASTEELLIYKDEVLLFCYE
jgi:hypothetical protein